MTKKVVGVDKRKAEEQAARSEALDALDSLVRKFGDEVGHWAMRKHLAVAAVRRSTTRKIRDLRSVLAQLEGSVTS